MNIAEDVTFNKEGQIERFGMVKRFFLALIIVLVSVLSFGIGRLAVVGESEPVRIEYNPEISNSQFPISNSATVSNALNTIENSKLKIENSTSVVGSSQ